VVSLFTENTRCTLFLSKHMMALSAVEIHFL